MQPTTALIYDGTFNGILTCIFLSYEEKLQVVRINPPGMANEELFCESLEVITDKPKADRVWKAFKKITSAYGAKNIYFAYLSEEPGIELKILKYFQHTFQQKRNIDGDYANPHVLKIAQTAKKVSREKHRMEAFVRFQLTKDHIYFATIEPDFNVLPLIKQHFTMRYRDQEWIIYDLKRKYGLYYNLHTTDFINIDFSQNLGFSEENDYLFEVGEKDFQKLWKKYFEATTIKSRINTRLHYQHVPRRYWKYLIEKNPLHN